MTSARLSPRHTGHTDESHTALDTHMHMDHPCAYIDISSMFAYHTFTQTACTIKLSLSHARYATHTWEQYKHNNFEKQQRLMTNASNVNVHLREMKKTWEASPCMAASWSKVSTRLCGLCTRECVHLTLAHGSALVFTDIFHRIFSYTHANEYQCMWMQTCTPTFIHTRHTHHICIYTDDIFLYMYTHTHTSYL